MVFHPRVFWKVLGAAAAAGLGPLVPEAQLSHVPEIEREMGLSTVMGVRQPGHGLFLA